MGQHAELMAQEWGITRAEQDQFALESHRKAAEAYRDGYMDDLVVPFAGVFRDNNMRADIDLEKMATLKTAFDKIRARHADGRQLDAADRRRRRGAARLRGVGGQARPAGAGLPHLLAGRGQRLRRRRGAADGADHRRVARCWSAPG